MKNIPHTILLVTSFSVNHNKPHKSRLDYEIKYRYRYDLYQIGQKIKN